MESGQHKGHREHEIIEAVIRGVYPGLFLRKTLEIKTGLMLLTLENILRDHFKVESSSDLLHWGMDISKDPKEPAQNFLFRAIELKEKMLWKASNEDEGV